MNNITIRKQRVRAISLILIFLITSIYGVLLFCSSSSFSNTKNNLDNNETFVNETPKSSLIGTHTWWDTTFRSRRLINITNPYSVSLNNYAVNISFNYKNFVDQGNMNKSLKDIRIIEYDSNNNPHARKYYFKKDYPTIDWVTVWFDTNISSTVSEYDTYLYYGNDEVEIDTTYFMNKTSAYDADNFGWIRNGNFELDIKTGQWINDVFGWYYADDAPDDLTSAVPVTQNINTYQHNLSKSFDGQEHVPEGIHTFKFGDIASDVSSGGLGDDIMGTLYSTPFVVPEVNGGSIAIRAWRNLRTYENHPSKLYFYRARICNTFSTNIDTHVGISNIEGWQTLSSVSVTTVEDTFGTQQINTAGDDLMDYFTFNIPEIYEGTTIFIEFVIYVVDTERSQFSAFCQVDDVSFNYILSTELEEIEERKSDVAVIVKDVDGRLVPNAEVFLTNNTHLNPIKYSASSTESDGTAYFTGVGYDKYDIWVNYTIPFTGNETVVYNSTEIPKNWTISEAVHTIEIEVDIWTIDFEIVDFGKEPLNYGYIEINYTKGGGFLDNLTLNFDGKATFRWKNKSNYYYKVYYDNDDYNLNPTILNESYISRDTYEQNNKYLVQELNITQYNQDPYGAGFFTVYQHVYTNGSLTKLGNKKIINANINITLPLVGSSFDRVRIYYIDKNNSTVGNLIYENETYAGIDKSDIIDIDIRRPPIVSGNLPGDSYEAYGLLIEVKGANSSICDGVIKVNFTETCNIYNITDLCKVNIKIIDSIGAGVSGCLVKVNSTNRDGLFEVKNNLLTKDFTGYAYGQINTDLPLWYLRGFNYTFSLIFFGSHKDLIVNYTDDWQPDGSIYSYAYNLTHPTNLTFEIDLGGVNASDYQTRFDNLSSPESVIWDQDVTIKVDFSLTEDNWASSEPVSLPANLFYTIKTTGATNVIVLEDEMDPQGNGLFETTFDSSLLSAGEKGKLYSIIISGYKVGYTNPTNLSDSIFIDTVPTNISMHDYYDSLTEITSFSQIFGETVNLTIRYANSFTELPLKGAALTYEWLNLDPVQFFEDPINDGYYTATIDTTIAEGCGTKSIEIIAKNENHTSQTLYTSLSIIERISTLNGETDLVYMNPKVWVEDPNPFEFFYQDEITEEFIGNLTTATYTWEELYANGTRIPGVHGSGTLIENVNKTHILDFNTEVRSVGYYYLYLTLQKQNYKARSALINLEIRLREFEPTINATQLSSNNQIRIDHGTDIDFEVRLWDKSRNVELENATVKFEFRGVNHTFAPSAATTGLYTLNLLTSTIDTFLTAQTFTGKIYIEAANFTKKERTVTITIKMEEIFPGMPSFYFILITVSIIGVLGSVVAYRVIQQARIPKHVKKIRKVKSLIKSKKTIEELISVPSKEQMIANLFGNDWKEIGLSLDETLGIQDLKSKKLALKNKISKEGGVD